MKTLTTNQLIALKGIADSINDENKESISAIKEAFVSEWTEENDDNATESNYASLEITTWRTHSAKDESEEYKAIDEVAKKLAVAGIDAEIKMHSGDSTDGMMHTAIFLLP